MESFKLLSNQELATVASGFRQKLLAAMEEPRSAASIAREFDVSRQRVGYHMRDLERAGCIELVAEQPARGLKERLYRARPYAFASAPGKSRTQLSREDRFSWRALVNLIAGSLWDLISLRRKADAAGKRLATLAIDAELHFRSPAERKAFAEELVDAVEDVLRRHAQPPTAGSRAFRLVLGAYPKNDEQHADRIDDTNDGGTSNDGQHDTQH